MKAKRIDQVKRGEEEDAGGSMHAHLEDRTESENESNERHDASLPSPCADSPSSPHADSPSSTHDASLPSPHDASSAARQALRGGFNARHQAQRITSVDSRLVQGIARQQALRADRQAQRTGTARQVERATMQPASRTGARPASTAASDAARQAQRTPSDAALQARHTAQSTAHQARYTRPDAARQAKHAKLDSARHAKHAAPDAARPTARALSGAHLSDDAATTPTAWFRENPGRTVAIAVAALIVLAALIAVPMFIGSGQAGDRAESDNAQSSSSTDAGAASSDASAEEPSDEPEKQEPNREALVAILGAEKAEQLIARAADSGDAAWIAANPDAFGFVGPELQAKILNLAADDPSALRYVRGFSDHYPAEQPFKSNALAMDAASPSPNVPSTSIPHLYQWDRRWGYTAYNGEAFGMSGCGPTTLAMIYQGVTGNTDLTPFDMGQLAYAGGYVVEQYGTSGDFFFDMAEGLGLACEMLPATGDSIRMALSEGRPVVANVGAGVFTDFGHFFVLAGLADDGSLIINDPYSVVRSSETWDADFIASQSIALFAYAPAM